MIEITVNGENKNVEENLNLQALLLKLDLPGKRIAIELNKNVVRKKDWSNTIVSGQDQIEIIHFVGGG